MLAIHITSLKSFMNHLLTADTFDLFLLEEAIVTTANTYHIDGHMNRDFFSTEELEDGICPYGFALWRDIKGLCFHLIKGKHTPLFFKFVLLLKPDLVESLLLQNHCTVDPSQIKSLVLTIKYDGEKAVLTTGSSCHTFLMTKEPDTIWDNAVLKYLSQKGIDYEEL